MLDNLEIINFSCIYKIEFLRFWILYIFLVSNKSKFNMGRAAVSGYDFFHKKSKADLENAKPKSKQESKNTPMRSYFMFHKKRG